MAFYAAVHVVNAYLWETRRYAPSNHNDRSREIQYTLPIRSSRGSYRNLSITGYHARYLDTFSLSQQQARTLLDVDSRRVEATVMQALGQPAPIW
jgi:hypothetical protein